MLVVGGQAGDGAGFNAVPGSAWFSIDRRFNPEEELGRELERLTDMVTEAADAAGAKVDIDVLQQQPSGSTDQAHPAARTLSAEEPADARDRPSNCAREYSTHAGIHNSGSPPSPTAADVSRSPMAPTSTSTKRPCAAARPSTPYSLRTSRDDLLVGCRSGRWKTTRADRHGGEKWEQYTCTSSSASTA